MSRTLESEDQPIKVTKSSSVLTNLGAIIAAAIAIWMASQQWNGRGRDTDETIKVVNEHSLQLTGLTTKTSVMEMKVNTLEVKMDAQMELLKYLARGRNGPLPDAAK